MAEKWTPAGSTEWTPDEIAKATGGVWLSQTRKWVACGITYAGRQVRPGFVVVIPDDQGWLSYPRRHQRPDLTRLREQGAVAVVASALPADVPADLPVLKVDSTWRAFTGLSDYARDRFNGTVIGVTGSAGKTTVKKFLTSILSRHSQVFKTRASWNTDTTLRLAMTLVPPDTDYVILECAMHRPGRVRRRARVIRPDIGIITQIAPAHAEFHNSIESIAREKSRLFEFLTDNGVAIINRDASHFPILRAAAGDHRTLTFGDHEQADLRLLQFRPSPQGTEIEAGIMGTRISYVSGTTGRHQALNTLAVLATVFALGLDIEEAAAGMNSLKAPNGRGRVVEVALPGGRLKIIDDSYNANPASMSALMNVLSLTSPDPGGRRIAMLGAMGELGGNSGRYHEELADAVINGNADLVITVGDAMKSLRRALPADICGPHLQEPKDIERAVLNIVRPADVIAIKGSHVWRLDKLVKALCNLETRNGKAASVQNTAPMEQ